MGYLLSQKQTIKKILCFLFISLVYYPQIASATIYQPGETLEPDCAPISPNCGVATTTLIGLFGYINATSTTATSTFANGINITGGCFAKNGVCIGGAGSDLQYVTSFKLNDTFTNITNSTTTLTTISITPSTVTGDVVVRAGVTFTSSNGTDQPVSLAIRETNCTGTILQSTLYANTASAGNRFSNLQLNYIAVDPGVSVQAYALCISASAGDTDVSAWDMSAIVVDTGADLAEIYTTNDEGLEAGDVVSIDSSLKAGIKKSIEAYDQNVIGIVSTRPGTIIGGVDKEGVKAVAVALSGRVPVKVTTENGNILPVDYLTPSSLPGIAMKASGTGPVIGQSLSAYNQESVGIILAFVKNFYLPEKKGFIENTLSIIRGYFDEIFSKKVHTDELCIKKSDGNEVCLNGDEMNSLLQNANMTPITISSSNNNGTDISNPEPIGSSTPVVTIDPIPEPLPEATTSLDTPQ